MTGPASTILFSEMTPPSSEEVAFNAWYDDEHIPIRMRAPGFRSAQRYRDGATSNYLAIYEMSSPEALRTPDYFAVKNQPSPLTREMLGAVSNFTRYLGQSLEIENASSLPFIDAPVLYAVFFTVPEERLADFDTWYRDEHVPMLLEEPAWLGVRRFHVFDGAPGPYNRLALHYITSRTALDSPARRRARNAPLRNALAGEPWFKGHYVMFDRLGSRFEGERTPRAAG